MQQQQQQQVATPQPVQSLMAAEEIRVDCVLMTSDGRNVITGSILGAPQVWDMTVSGYL